MRVNNMSLQYWLTVDIRQSMKQRDRFEKENYREFKKQRRQVKYLVGQATENIFCEIVSNQIDNTSLDWKGLNALLGNIDSLVNGLHQILLAVFYYHFFVSLAKTLNKRFKGEVVFQCSNTLRSRYLDRFNLIHTHQQGFRPQHSCQ